MTCRPATQSHTGKTTEFGKKKVTIKTPTKQTTVEPTKKGTIGCGTPVNRIIRITT
jgi:hypothetical protein